MKLLIDQNISFRIIPRLHPLYDSLTHVRDVGLINADDRTIFNFAKKGEYAAIITLDDDFVKLLDALGTPPKVIWLRLGNSSNEAIADILRSKFDAVKEFLENEELYLYEIFKV